MACATYARPGSSNLGHLGLLRGISIQVLGVEPGRTLRGSIARVSIIVSQTLSCSLAVPVHSWNKHLIVQRGSAILQ
eukprot:1348918-Pyramimonas_sp.AAC.1